MTTAGAAPLGSGICARVAKSSRLSGRRTMVLTKRFPSEAFARALESWSWLDLAGKVPVLSSMFGDLFLQDPTGYWFLDSIEGSLSKVAADRAELQSILDTTDGQDKYLLGAPGPCGRATWACPKRRRDLRFPCAARTGRQIRL